MKHVAHILFLTFFILTVCPTVKAISCKKKTNCFTQRLFCKGKGSCNKENAEDCPIKMCNACQCCVCFSVCTVDNNKVEIMVFQTQIKNNSIVDQFILSDFIADRWQPPKTV